MVITVITIFTMQSQTFDLKIVPIGNSQGIRLPKPLLQRYGIEGHVLAEQTPQGILLRSTPRRKASLEDTFSDMARAGEDWQDWDAASADGLNKLAW
jgi:antitoxin MazE